MYVCLNVEPIACPRPKISKWGAYYPAKYTKWKKQTSQMLRAYPHLSGDAFEVSLCFVLKRPKSQYRKKDPSGRIMHTKRPDLDNLIKAILDCIVEADLLGDDCNIVSLNASKWIAAKEEDPTITIQIKKRDLSEDPSLPISHN